MSTEQNKALARQLVEEVLKSGQHGSGRRDLSGRLH